MEEDLPLSKGNQVPPIIHFIWAGGVKPLPRASVNVIAEWARENKDYTILLWVDAETSGKSFESLKAEYAEAFAGLGLREDQLQLKDIREAYKETEYRGEHNSPMIDDCSQYEIERLRPNYGGSSDLLRYHILYKYGGAYFDSDVEPAKKDHSPLKACKLQDFLRDFQSESEHFVLFLDHLTQMPNETVARNILTSQEESSGPTEGNILKLKNLTQNARIGNDAFICSKRNPLMKAIYDRARQNYHDMEVASKSLDSKDSTHVRIMLAYGNNYRRSITIGTTGPHLVRKVLRSKSFGVLKDDFNLTVLEVNSVPVMVKPLRSEDYCLVEPLDNTLNWLKVPITQKYSLDDAIDAALKTVIFELNNFNILRLEDHIRDIICALSLGGVNVTPEEVTQKLLEKIAPLIERHEQKQELVVQCVFEYPQVQAFYEERRLTDQGLIWGNSESQKQEILRRHAAVDFILGEVLDSIKDGKLNSSYQKPPQMAQILECICSGISFIDNFLKDEFCPENFANDSGHATDGATFWQLCRELLQGYGRIYHAVKKEPINDEMRPILHKAEVAIKLIGELDEKIQKKQRKLGKKLPQWSLSPNRK